MTHGLEWLKENGQVRGKRLLCLVDGEHYPPVVDWAVRELKASGAEIAGLLFLGGTEKIGGTGGYGKNSVPRDTGRGREPVFYLQNLKSPREEIGTIAAETRPDAAVDLSDDPVVRFEDRIRLAACFQLAGVPYWGADFSFAAPEKKQQLTKPSIRIWGTNKRVGKTAVTVYTASVLKERGCRPAIVSMGRGGPEEPEVILPDKNDLTPRFLLDRASEGVHAASDCWEDAVLSRVPTIGCRRCGGGLAGNAFISNVTAGVEIANSLDAGIVIMEGSGPTSPPVKTDSSILVVSARIPPEEAVDFFGEYRIMDSDLVFVTMCKTGRREEIYRRIKKVRSDVPVVLTGFTIEPGQDISGKKVFVAVTAAEERDMETGLMRLEGEYGCRVTGFSNSLSDRKKLVQDIEEGLPKSDLLLTELKAASIDVGAKYAEEYGKEVVFFNNRPVLLGGDFDDLKQAVLSTAGIAAGEPAGGL
jgi:cyclic 2,3-diphosphoglycerate synthetase